MVGEARHQHVRDQRLGRQTALDQPCGCGCLHHQPGAGSAGKLGSLRHDHPELCRDHVEPFGTVLADHRHRRPATRAVNVFGCDHHLDARQMRRQRAASNATCLPALPLERWRALLRLGLELCDRNLEVVDAELQLRLGQTLGSAAKLQALELEQQVTQPVVLLRQRITFGRHRVTLGRDRVALGRHRILRIQGREQLSTQRGMRPAASGSACEPRTGSGRIG